jgi:hypothetical protein
MQTRAKPVQVSSQKPSRSLQWRICSNRQALLTPSIHDADHSPLMLLPFRVSAKHHGLWREMKEKIPRLN